MKIKMLLVLVINSHILAVPVTGSKTSQTGAKTRASPSSSSQSSTDMNISREVPLCGAENSNDSSCSQYYAAYSSGSFSPPMRADDGSEGRSKADDESVPPMPPDDGSEGDYKADDESVPPMRSDYGSERGSKADDESVPPMRPDYGSDGGSKADDESVETKDTQSKSNRKKKSRRKTTSRSSKSKSASLRTSENHSESTVSLDGIVVEPAMDYSQYSTLTSAISPSQTTTERDLESSVRTSFTAARESHVQIVQRYSQKDGAPPKERVFSEGRITTNDRHRGKWRYNNKLANRDVYSASSVTDYQNVNERTPFPSAKDIDRLAPVRAPSIASHSSARGEGYAKLRMNFEKKPAEQDEITECPPTPPEEASHRPFSAIEIPFADATDFSSWDVENGISPIGMSDTTFHPQESGRASSRADWNDLERNFLANNPYAGHLLRKSRDYEGDGVSHPFPDRFPWSRSLPPLDGGGSVTSESKQLLRDREGISVLDFDDMRKVKRRIAPKKYLVILFLIAAIGITIALTVNHGKRHPKSDPFGGIIPVEPPSVIPKKHESFLSWE